jgi:hypothetical protein
MILRLSTNNSNALVFVPKIRAKFGLLMSLGIGGSLDTHQTNKTSFRLSIPENG